MKKFNVIVVFDKEYENILMCRRTKEPYKGLLNMVGGKVEEGEEDYKAAYRELKEETGITKNDINLKCLMNLEYMISELKLGVFVGKLNKDVKLVEEVNKLCWISKSENFFDSERFAGEGNIGHMIKRIEMNKEKIFNE